MPATIKFRGKPEEVYNLDDTFAYAEVKVPVPAAHHCDMRKFRAHRTIGAYANSDLFPAVLKGVLAKMGVRVGGRLRLDQLPNGVTVDTSKFLATVTITVADDATWR
ncbi:hypothetical protein [Amycolatopsis sp. NPDC021455]|uniref:hypothetical protein n=1 Tax=Amycolatopsis sp. NPDC021455 TaxID=3154901 RepID=UPI0033E67135